MNQQQVFGVATPGVQAVLHTEFCWIRCKTTAVPIQPVIDLRQQRTQKKSFALTAGVEAHDTRTPPGAGLCSTNPARLNSGIQYFLLVL